MLDYGMRAAASRGGTLFLNTKGTQRMESVLCVPRGGLINTYSHESTKARKTYS